MKGSARVQLMFTVILFFGILSLILGELGSTAAEFKRPNIVENQGLGPNQTIIGLDQNTLDPPRCNFSGANFLDQIFEIGGCAGAMVIYGLSLAVGANDGTAVIWLIPLFVALAAVIFYVIIRLLPTVN